MKLIIYQKQKKIEGFTKTELKDVLYDKLKNHLFIYLYN